MTGMPASDRPSNVPPSGALGCDVTEDTPACTEAD